MEIYEQLVYSLCSKNTKEAIKSLNLEKGWITINVHNSIELNICTVEFVALNCCFAYDHFFPNNRMIAREDIKVVVDPYGASIRWGSNFQNSEFKEWLHHFCEVLHHPKIDGFYFSGEKADDNYIEPIQKAIKGFQIGRLVIENESTPEFTKKALEGFSNYEKLLFDRISFDSRKVYEMDKFLIQNLRSVSIPDTEEIKIDQVLVSNSERIFLRFSKFSETELNRFLKLWIRGSNPRLKFFYAMGQPLLGSYSFDMNLVLKRIKSNQIPLDSEEVHREKVDGYDFEETKLAGGYRILNFNGTTAVIMPIPPGQLEFIVE